MTFTTTKMVDQRVLVRGTDVLGNAGQTVVSSAQWEAIKADQAFDVAAEEFDAAVEEFFAPIVEAAEKMHKQVTKPELDEVAYIVVNEAVEGVAEQKREIVKLTHDSVVLRLIEEGKSDRLVWVDESTLEVLAEAPATPAPAVSLPADADPS